MTTAQRPVIRRSGNVNRSKQAKGSRSVQQAVPPPEQPYVPNILTNEWIHGFHRDTIEQTLQQLGKQLIHDRQLPNFYFRQVLVEEGIEPARAARWDPRRWVASNGKVNISDYGYQLLALTAFLKISRFLSEQPPDETYTQALKRLRSRMEQLLDNDMSRAEIAKRLDLNPKTVSCVLRDRHTGRTRICPWEVLHRIELTDWTPAPKIQRRPRRFTEPPTPHSLTDNEVSHSRAKDRAAQRQATRARRNYVRTGGHCWKCRATYTHLRPEGPPEGKLQELICRMCGSSSYLRTTAPKNRR